jgi:hypothetical protein
MAEQTAETVRHVQVETPNWDTKVRCSCGAVFVSRCEFWKHGYEALLAARFDGDVTE